MLSNKFPDMTDKDWDKLELSQRCNWLYKEIQFLSFLGTAKALKAVNDYGLELKELKQKYAKLLEE